MAAQKSDNNSCKIQDHKEWEELKNPGVYEVRLRDYVLNVIAHCTKKDILVFNTNLQTSPDPVSVVEAKTLGGQDTDNEIPVLLAYDGNHYEGLIPRSHQDIIKTIELKQHYLNGQYAIEKKDVLEFLEHFENDNTGDRKRKGVNNNVTYLSKKKIKDMTKEEYKEYKRMKQIESRTKKRLCDEKAYKAARAKEEAKRRSKLREENPAEFKEAQAKEKANRRSKLKDENPAKFNAARAKQEADRRSKLKDENPAKFNAARAKEEANRRSKLREENPSKFKASQAREKAEQRKRLRDLNEALFKAKRANEKRKFLEREERRKCFLTAIKNGRAYECICCHRRLFQAGVISVPEDYKSYLDNRYPGSFNAAIGTIVTKKTDGCYHICHTCKNYVEKGKIPPMSHQNSLHVFDYTHYPELKLTDLENNLIALNLLFKKLYELPKSRMPAMKDKTVNIPIFEADVINTVQSLPRTPTEAGIIAINLKRKMEYENVHKCQYVSVEKIIKALQTMKSIGNPYYQFVPDDIDDFEKRCKETDGEGYDLLFPSEVNDEIDTEHLPSINPDKQEFAKTNIERNDFPWKKEVIDEIETSSSFNEDFEEAEHRRTLKIENHDNLKSSQAKKKALNQRKRGQEKFEASLAEKKSENQKKFQATQAKEKAKRRKCEEIEMSSLTDSDDEDDDEQRKCEELEIPSLADLEDEIEDDDESLDRKNDCIKRWQFNYNKSTCFSDNYPEISFKEIKTDTFSVAPGEGKIPTNILEEIDWDVKSFPCLHPDGKNSLNFARKIKLIPQDYFNQRLLNKDFRFAQNAAYIFAVAAFIEKRQIERNKGISYIRGKATRENGHKKYSLEDPYCVLDNIKNTPRYWQKARYELIARLENLGPFTWFFTLSCGDMRWPENFTALLRDRNIGYEYKNGEEIITIDGVCWKEWLQEHESEHEFIRNNLLNATLTFNNRVKMFIKHILMNKGNPMTLQHYSYKVEFALRGAAHIHGVLWMDWESFKAMPKNEVESITSALQKIKKDEKISPQERVAIAKFADLFITCSLKDYKTEDIVRSVNTHNHTKSCRKYGSSCRFKFPRYPSLRTMVSVPVDKSDIADEDQDAEMKSCEKILENVRNVLEDEDQMREICKVNEEEIEKYKYLLKCKGKIDVLLANCKDKQSSILVDDPFLLQEVFDIDGKQKRFEKDEIENISSELEQQVGDLEIDDLLRERLLSLLRRCKFEDDDDDKIIEAYEKALSLSRCGYRFVLKRDVDEIFVNNYNQEWIHCWNANMDIQLCLDFFAVITYISDYYSKDDSGTLDIIRKALKDAESKDLRSRLELVAYQFLTHRMMGETEAYYRILPSLHMQYSNVETIFIPTGFKENRSRFLQKISEEESKYFPEYVEINGREGKYIEKPSLLDKYVRRDSSKHLEIKNLSYLQFCKRYVASRKGPKDDKQFQPEIYQKDSSGGFGTFSEIDFIVTDDFQDKTTLYKLPKFIKISNLIPGEPGFMKLRSPMVARMHKFSQLKTPHEFYYSELQLYKPFSNEDELAPNDLDQCQNLYSETSSFNLLPKVINTKSILMKFLTEVEEGTEREQEILDSNAGAMLDPENEQDNDDCDAELKNIMSNDETDWPAEISGNSSVQSYRKIELYDDEQILSLTRSLDYDQRRVLDIAVNFAKTIVKNKKISKHNTKAPLVVIQGCAGSGKSHVIDAMTQQMEKIIRSEGDDPTHPYILKAAFTGTAASNIKGQTLHNAFSFKFGNEFTSLSDKSRDERRKLLENLKVIIIDEYSMLPSDMIYLIDLRLKEITQRKTVPFGGVAVFLFGDILQLKPVKARYAFEEPKCESYWLSHAADSLWEKFDVVMLNTNHRQGEDRKYADVLLPRRKKIKKSRTKPYQTIPYQTIPNQTYSISSLKLQKQIRS